MSLMLSTSPTLPLLPPPRDDALSRLPAIVDALSAASSACHISCADANGACWTTVSRYTEMPSIVPSLKPTALGPDVFANATCSKRSFVVKTEISATVKPRTTQRIQSLPRPNGFGTRAIGCS